MAKGIKMLSIDELEQMNEKELKAEVARLKARLRSRRASLKKEGLADFADAATPQVDRSSFSAEKKRLLAEIKELQAKLNDPLSTVKGVKAWKAKTEKEANNGSTTGGSAHDRYTAIMDLVSPSDRDYIRDQGSQSVFKYTEIILKQGLSQGMITKEDFDKAVSDYANSTKIRDGNIF